MTKSQLEADIAERSERGAEEMPNPGSWAQIVKTEASPKLTFEAFEKAKAVAKQYIGEEVREDARIVRDFNPSVQRGFNEAIDDLLLGNNVVTLADANARIEQRITEFRGYLRGAGNSVANASRINVTIGAIRTFGEALNREMQMQPARAA